MYIRNGALDIILNIKNHLRKLNRMQIQVLVALLILCILPLIAVSARAVQNYRQEELQEKYAEAVQLCHDFSSRVQSASINSTSLPSDVSGALDIAAQIYDGRIIVINSELLVIKDTYEREEGKTMISEEVVKAIRGEESVYKNSSENTVELICPIRDSQNSTVLGTIIFIYSVETTTSMVEALSRSMSLFNTAIFILVVLIAFLFSARLTMPLKHLVFSLQKFADGYQEEKIKVKGNYEVEEITESLNNMLDEMRDTEQRRQEFVANVSHELKTPLTSMKVLADSLLSQPDAPAELYQEFLTDINSEISRENKIITDLLELVRLDRKEGEMHIAQVSINELLEIVMRRLRPMAKQRNIEMVFESFRNVIAEIDEVKISLVFTNLIENAIKYNYDGGEVKVSLNADHKYFFVKVEDTGVGIPEESKKFVFDRFYRVDKARSRETGGTGLGLAIAKSAVVMHKGNIKVSGKEGEGSTFVVRIPLSFVPEFGGKGDAS